MNDALQTAQAIASRFAENAFSTSEFRGEWTVVVNKQIIPDVAKFLKEELNFLYLVDASGVDYFGQEPRFEMVYEFYNYSTRTHIRIKTRVSEDDLQVPTISGIYATADWHEREAYDMYGIQFTNHPDLRRILMWEGFPYHPLRKDFPLEGKSSDCEQAFTRVAPLEGGPFVTVAGACGSTKREPRAHPPEL